MCPIVAVLCAVEWAHIVCACTPRSWERQQLAQTGRVRLQQHTYNAAAAAGCQPVVAGCLQVPAREAPEMQQMLGLDPSRGDKCLGFFVVGSADAEVVAGYRPKRQPLEDKVVWKL